MYSIYQGSALYRSNNNFQTAHKETYWLERRMRITQISDTPMVTVEVNFFVNLAKISWKWFESEVATPSDTSDDDRATWAVQNVDDAGSMLNVEGKWFVDAKVVGSNPTSVWNVVGSSTVKGLRKNNDVY